MITYSDKCNLMGERLYAGSHFKGIVQYGREIQEEWLEDDHTTSIIRKQKDEHTLVLNSLSLFYAVYEPHPVKGTFSPQLTQPRSSTTRPCPERL